MSHEHAALASLAGPGRRRTALVVFAHHAFLPVPLSQYRFS
ncbi:hypothetical protein ACFV8Z_18065 [Streptomyces sp. NPDC059837]